MLLIQELFENDTYAKPVYAKNDDGSSVLEEMWEDHIIQEGHEGLVLQTDGETVKIKPNKNVDALVIAVKPDKYGTSMGSLFLALLDEENSYRTLSFVGTGFSDEDRKEWFDWANKNFANNPNHDNLVWVDISKEPRIVEVNYEQSLVKELETFNFKDGKWEFNESEKLSSTLRKPVFVRIRDDKKVNAQDLRLSQIPELDEAILKKKSFKINAFYPKHPDTIIVKKNKFYTTKPLLEKDIWNFYDKVKYKIIEQTKGKNILVYLRVDGDIIKRKNDGILRIDNVNDFQRMNSGRFLEVHSEISYERGSKYYTDIIFCDIDPQENFKFNDTKELVKKVYAIFKKDQHVKNVKIHYSGGRGFHILGSLKQAWDVDQARDYTRKLLKQLETDNVKLGIVREKNMARLDTSLLKARGSLRVAYSINKETGLVALPLAITELDKFKKEDATIYKVLKRLDTKKAFKIQSDDNPYSGVISGLWAIWRDDVEAATSHGLYHESWFPTVGFPDKGTILGRSLYDRVTRGRFMIIDETMQIRIYKNAGNPEEALDKSDRLLNKIGHKDKYKNIQFWIDDERSSDRVAAKLKFSLKKASILDYPKPGLEPKVWNFDGTININVKTQILGKLNKFIEAQGYSAKDIINKIYIVGSLTSYQYNKLTDLDTHVYLNLRNMLGIFKGNEEDLIELIDKSWRKTLNKAESELIEGTQHPLEFYFEIPEDLSVAPSDGVYDLLNDEWLKEPKVITVDFDVDKLYPEIINKAKEIAKELDIQIGELKRDVTDAEMIQEMIEYLSDEQKKLFVDKLTSKIEEVDTNIVDLLKVEQGISDKRHEDYAWDSEGNILFKYLQRFGYIGLLKTLEKSIGADKKFNLDDIDNVQKVLAPIKSFKLVSFKFDQNVSKEVVEQRYRLKDPALFEPDSFRRWSEWAGIKAPKGVTFLVGDLKNDKGKALQTIRFNTKEITEKEAGNFWNKINNKKGFEKTWTQKDWANWLKHK